MIDWEEFFDDIEMYNIVQKGNALGLIDGRKVFFPVHDYNDNTNKIFLRNLTYHAIRKGIMVFPIFIEQKGIEIEHNDFMFITHASIKAEQKGFTRKPFLSTIISDPTDNIANIMKSVIHATDSKCENDKELLTFMFYSDISFLEIARFQTDFECLCPCATLISVKVTK